MMKTPSIALLLGCALGCGATLTAAPARYVVLISETTAETRGWGEVVTVLTRKHAAQTERFHAEPNEALPFLREAHPRFLCLVARPEEVTREFVALVHRMVRRLDDDPYADCRWGILTGYDAANALAIARTDKPLTVHRVAAGTDVALEMCEEGQWYCELKPHRHVIKEPGQAPREERGPLDTTAALVGLLNDYRPDLFVTSGHATEHDWQIGYAYRNGSFRHAEGRLFGRDLRGERFPVDSPNPKVYLPIGNCLMGHIDRPDCMATSWMNRAGVRQMIGYTVPTWYGYAGWGMLDYFVEQPGRYTFAEAFLANQHALIHRLATFFPDLVEAEIPPGGRPRGRVTAGPRALAAGLSAQDGYGLLFDRDVLAFYGDPAWEARMAPRPCRFRQSLVERDGIWTFRVEPAQGDDSYAPVNTNGVQRGGRPFLAFLPRRVTDIRLIAGADLHPVITDDFVLLPHPGTQQPARPLEVRFQAKPAH